MQKESRSKSNNDGFSKLSDMLMNIAKQARKVKKAQRILKSLHFEQIKARQSEVKDAHRTTFKWIFAEEENSNFSRWLHSENGVYWVARKAGLGKSTLMKFLCNHPRSRLAPKEWAGQSQIVVATHFF
jgi:hypothetical protein